MSRKKNKIRKNKSQQRVLLDHKKVGKHYIPPMVQYGNFDEIKWVDSKLPELLWLGLVNHTHGPAKGLKLGLSLALAAVKAYANQDMPWFGTTSAYTLLNDTQKDEVLDTLRPNNLQPLKDALVIFPMFYPQCPLNFLFEDSPSILSNPEPLLEDFKHLLSTLFDRTKQAATFMQTHAVYIAGATGKLKVQPDSSLANLPAIDHYPHTEESKKVAAAVRAVMNVLIMTLYRQTPNTWPAYFWDRSLEIQQCKLEKIWTEYE